MLGVILVFIVGIIMGLPFCFDCLSEIKVKTGHPRFGMLTIAYKLSANVGNNSRHSFLKAMKVLPNLKRIIVFYKISDFAKGNESAIYASGVILNEDGSEPSEIQKKSLQSLNYKVYKFPVVNYAVITTHPFRSFLTVYIAVRKAYPKLYSYIRRHNLCAHPILEIYGDGRITFLVPLTRQCAFYVPESLPLVQLYKKEEEEEEQEELETSPLIRQPSYQI